MEIPAVVELVPFSLFPSARIPAVDAEPVDDESPFIFGQGDDGTVGTVFFSETLLQPLDKRNFLFDLPVGIIISGISLLDVVLIIFLNCFLVKIGCFQSILFPGPVSDLKQQFSIPVIEPPPSTVTVPTLSVWFAPMSRVAVAPLTVTAPVPITLLEPKDNLPAVTVVSPV